MLPELDPLLHSQLRLQIMSLLAGISSAEFNFLLEETGATRGNVSVQIKKLSEAGYIKVSKSFGESYPLTTCNITDKGLKAFDTYVENISKYLDRKKE
ncbi:MAG: transcriptional regulator [Owenweeksia sp.]|nr:transcriptional regulator [Owenweeksia sp.]MBF99698.1 transcriptional regulator [Owenweeksia sp.]HCQ16966.1 transcriptional regulator [Cryomorphaceae bacterium]|tara:strand:+ start:297 stop:590 length:294 start_codon:yes stop_codon:yes gene_type:complete